MGLGCNNNVFRQENPSCPGRLNAAREQRVNVVDVTYILRHVQLTAKPRERTARVADGLLHQDFVAKNGA